MRAERDVAKRFPVDVAEHQMEVIRSAGIDRHLRFRKPGTSCMGFERTEKAIDKLWTALERWKHEDSDIEDSIRVRNAFSEFAEAVIQDAIEP